MNQKNALATTKDQVGNIRALIDKSKTQIALALPKHLSVDRLARIVMTSIQKTPKLLECTQSSLLGAVIQAAQLGLEPDGVLGEAYLIPYWNAKARCMECQFQTGYKGLVKLARQSGQISTIAARVVRSGDQFHYELGLEEKLGHIPRASPDSEITHVYAIAKLKDGGHQFEVMTSEEIEAVRQRSKSGEQGPWMTDWPEMAKKTVLRRLCKLLPASVEMAKAVAYDELSSAGLPQEFENAIEVGEDAAPAPKPKGLDALIAQDSESPGPTETHYEEPPPSDEDYGPTPLTNEERAEMTGNKSRTVNARQNSVPYLSRKK